MGFNTVLFLCNDHLHTIEKEGLLGKAISEAIGLAYSGVDSLYFPQLAKACIGGVQPIATEHADTSMVTVVGQNMGECVGYSRNTGLRALADVLRQHGYRVEEPIESED